MTKIRVALEPGFHVDPPRGKVPDRAKRSVAVVRPLPDAGEADSAAALTDRDIITVIAVLADEYEEMDAMFREGPLTRLWHFFPG